MKSLDTNTLLRLVLADVPLQTAKVEALFDDTSQKYTVADLVFAEVLLVLQGKPYMYGRSQIAEKVKAILAISQIDCNRVMLVKSLSLYISYPKISFIDACLAVYAELNDAKPLLTFDKKLATALPQTVVSL